MKIATVSIGGKRRVGEMTFDGTAFIPFDLPVFEANDGILALIRRDGASSPLTLSLLLLVQVAMEAPIPRPRNNTLCMGKNYYEYAHEFARSSFDSGSDRGAVPDSPIIFSKVPEALVASGRAVMIDAKVSQAAAPTSIARELADKIYAAKTVTLHRCGRWTPIEKVKECGTLLSDFPRGIPV